MKRFARPHVPEAELHAYADNEVSGGQRAEIAEHLMGCLICRAQYAEVQDLRIRTSEILSIAVPKIPAALQANGPAALNTRPVRLTIRRSALMAAGIALTVIGASSVANDATLTSARVTLARIFAAPTLFATTAPVASMRASDPLADFTAASGWSVLSWEDALRLNHTRVRHIAGLPITAVRVSASTTSMPAIAIRQTLPDGTSAWLLSGTSLAAAQARKALAARGLTVREYTGAPTIAAMLAPEDIDALARRIE
ncbi:MAG: zf-HC2 domain-containing protein [Gemmatimonadales bacterium]